MNRTRISAKALVLIVCLLLALVAGVVFYLFLATAGDVLNRVIYALLICIGLFLFAGLLLNRWLARPLTFLRLELPQLLHGESPRRFAIAEIDALSSALGSLLRDLQTQQRRSEQERSELANLLESGTEGLLQVNEAGRIVHVNEAASHLLRLPPNSRGQAVGTMVRQADLRDLLIASVGGAAVPPREIDVDDRHLLVVCRPAFNGAGAVAAIMDLTEVRRLEAVRRDFVANVSHELKTPLTSIRGYAETLLADDVPRDLRIQFLDIIQNNATRIQRIVDDLLDLSRLQSGGWRPELQDVDAADLAEDVWAGCCAAVKKKIEFDVVASGSSHVEADPGGLRQVFANLFDNALRYTPDGGRVHVRIREVRNGKRSADAQSEWIEIQVQDTGAGIPRDALPRIFERFYRVDPARSRADGGTGLGLSIVKHLLESMDGEVAADSDLGKGTTIRFRLPAA